MAEIKLPRRNKTKDLEQMKHAAAQARLPFDKDMLLNTAFFLDHQYTEWVAESNMIRTIPRNNAERHAPRPVANKIMHFVMQEHAYALANRPTVDVLPASEEPADVSFSNVAISYLRWLFDPSVCDFETELSDAVFNALLPGEGYLKWVFDAAKKRPDVLSVHPLDIYADPYAKKFRQARWVIHEQFMDVQEIKDVYDVEVKPSTVDTNKAALLREMGHAPVLDGAVVNELWIKPMPGRYQNGLFVVWSGKDLLVEADRFPYKHGELPFTQLGSIPRPKTPHYTSAVKYMRSPNMELNKYHAQKLMSREAFASPKWWIPTELELEEEPNDSPRQILRGSGMSGFKPEIIQGDVMRDPGDGDWIKQEMQDIVGLHEVSQAQVPGRVEAAKAIELLKEADMGRLYELERTIKTGISQGGWQMLMLANQFAPESQIVQTYSQEGYPEVKEFKAADMKPATRVRVTMGTGLSRSRANREESAMIMWEKGIIQDPETFAQIMDVPVETVSPQRAFDIRLARNENLTMASGKDGVAIVPNSWDQHDIHIREHNNYRKTGEFGALNEEAKQKFEFHVQQHQELELVELQKEAQRQMIMQGVAPSEAPPEEEGASEGAA